MTNSYEPNQDDPVQRLIEANEVAGLSVARNTERFEGTGADMIMRNIAVICDRLRPEEFNALSKETRDQVAVVAHISHDVSPMKEENLARQPHESDEDYEYRVAVWGPIHSMQSKIHTRDFEVEDPLQMSKIRFGVMAAGKAFGTVLQEAQNLPEISRTISYFQGNTKAAVSSASR